MLALQLRFGDIPPSTQRPHRLLAAFRLVWGLQKAVP